MNNKKVLGNFGEKIAQTYLQNLGYEILKTNYFSNFGEIDIIAKNHQTLIFIEVKTRTSNFEKAKSSISSNKQKKLIKTAQSFLSKNIQFNNLFTRFDAIIVLKKRDGTLSISHIKDAFRPEYY